MDAAARTGAEVLSSQGSEIYVAPRHAAYRDWEMKNPLHLAQGMAEHMLVGPAPDNARAVTRAIAACQPNLVVSSFTNLGAMLAAEAQGAQFDVLIPNVYPMPAQGMPPMGTGLAPARGALGRIRDDFLNRVSTLTLSRYVLPKLNNLRAEYGLAPLNTHWSQIHRARKELILTSSHFDFPASLPSTARYVGPILDDPAWADADEWVPPPGNAPLVLVSMSSTFQNQLSVLQRICDALSGLPLRALVTTGPALDPARLSAAGNVSVVRAAPHRAVLDHASLVITHGGHGTVVKALSAGVPLVVIQHGRDQADNAMRVTARGAGLSISRRSSRTRIRKAVEHALRSNSMNASAVRLGTRIRESAGANLIRELEDLPVT